MILDIDIFLKAGVKMENSKFINDEDAIGKWTFYAIIKDDKKFDINTAYKPYTDKGFKEIYFLPDGQKYWIFEGWTKGSLFVHYGGDEPVLCYNYAIRRICNRLFMFIKIEENGELFYNVLEKVSDKKFELKEIGNRDNINLPFILDNKVLGTWKAVGFVKEIADFNKPDYKTKFWLKNVLFNEDGSVIRTYDDEKWTDLWTKGFLLDQTKSTASSYEIRTLNNKEYLFLQWKMGNYVFNNEKPSYYVFER